MEPKPTKPTPSLLRVVLLTADEVTGQGRIYPEAVLRKAAADAQQALEAGKVFCITEGGSDDASRINGLVKKVAFEGKDFVVYCDLATNDIDRWTLSARGVGSVVGAIVSNYEFDGVYSRLKTA